jgi:hypothetical protein
MVFVLAACGGAQQDMGNMKVVEQATPTTEEAETPAEPAEEDTEEAETPTEPAEDAEETAETDETPDGEPATDEEAQTPTNTRQPLPTPTPTITPEPAPELDEAQVQAIQESILAAMEEEGMETEGATVSVVNIIEGYALATVNSTETSKIQVAFLQEENGSWNVIAGPKEDGFYMEDLEGLDIPEELVASGLNPN